MFGISSLGLSDFHVTYIRLSTRQSSVKFRFCKIVNVLCKMIRAACKVHVKSA